MFLTYIEFRESLKKCFETHRYSESLPVWWSSNTVNKLKCFKKIAYPVKSSLWFIAFAIANIIFLYFMHHNFFAAAIAITLNLSFGAVIFMSAMKANCDILVDIMNGIGLEHKYKRKNIVIMSFFIVFAVIFALEFALNIIEIQMLLKVPALLYLSLSIAYLIADAYYYAMITKYTKYFKHAVFIAYTDLISLRKDKTFMEFMRELNSTKHNEDLFKVFSEHKNIFGSIAIKNMYEAISKK